MTNEQTIGAICSELVRYGETVHGGASRAMRHAEHALLSAQRQLAAKDAEIAELKQRLADSGRDLQVLKADPVPGEWVEWKGGRCPIANGVLHQVRMRDGYLSGDDFEARYWIGWEHMDGENDIVAYRVLA